jgi:hypothetical protein
MAIRDEALFTTIYDEPSLFRPPADAVYVARSGIEDRSHHADDIDRKTGVLLVSVIEEHPTTIDLRIGSNEQINISLRSAGGLADFWKQFSGKAIYLDITGLRHHSWIPLLRSALQQSMQVQIVYVEPRDYSASVNPTEGEIYDLSSKILGISPIPGFASFARVKDDFFFVPLLGFEGTRVAYLLEQVQPSGDRTIPIVGVPGFRAEYPFATYMGNRLPLVESDAWRRVRFADANCPYGLYHLLQKVSQEYEEPHLKIAPIGTKPHAVGAVLFVLDNPTRRELVYDHPVRRAQRTSGRARLLAYDITGFRNR